MKYNAMLKTWVLINYLIYTKKQIRSNLCIRTFFFLLAYPVNNTSDLSCDPLEGALPPMFVITSTF